MGQVVTIGLDIAKSVFQVHGVDAEGAVVIRQKLPRARLLSFFAKLEPCLVGIEACGASHHWARELTRLGHEARLMPPSYVKPYLKRQKNDMADADIITFLIRCFDSITTLCNTITINSICARRLFTSWTYSLFIWFFSICKTS